MAKAKKGDNTRRSQQGASSVSRKVKTVPGQPGVPMYTPGPVEGKRGVRRLIKRDPSIGKSMPEADRITDTHTDLGGASSGSVRIVRKGNPYETAPLSGKKKIIAAPAGRLTRR